MYFFWFKHISPAFSNIMLGAVFLMSTKSTILLTNDNEHWYNDCSEPLTGIDEKPHKDVITLEFSKRNIRIDLNDSEDLVISIVNPNCEIYDILSKLAKELRGF